MSGSENISDILRRAERAVRDAGLPEDLRAEGFAAAVQLLARGSVDGRDSAPNNLAVPGKEGDADQPGSGLDVLSRFLEVPTEIVEDVYFLDDSGFPQVGVARSRLARRTAEAARQLALMCVAAQQCMGERFTEAAVIRDVCRDYGVLDVNNFGKTLTSMRDAFQFQGTGASRRVRLIRPGIEQAGQLVQELAS